MIGRWFSDNRLLVGFILLSTSSGVAAGIMQLVFPLYALSLSIGDGDIGLIRGSTQLCGLLTTLPGGFLVDRFGARRMYIVSGLVNALAICIIPTAATFSLLMLFLLFEGCVGNIRWTALNTAFFERLNSIGVSRAGWMRAAMAIGLSFLGPLIGGSLAHAFSFQINYLLIGMCILVPVCLLLLLQPNSSPPPLQLAETEPVPFPAQLRELLANRLLMNTALNQSLTMSSFNAFSVFIIIFLVKTLNCSPGMVSLIISVQGAAFVLIMFCGVAIMRRISSHGLYALCYLLQIGGLVAVGYSDRLWLIAAGSVSLGLGAGLMTTNSYAMLGNLVGKKGKATGLFYLITGAGISLGPVLSGFLVTQFGIRAAFTGFIPLQCCAFVYFIFIMIRRALAERYPLQTLGDTET